MSGISKPTNKAIKIAIKEGTGRNIPSNLA